MIFNSKWDEFSKLVFLKNDSLFFNSYFFFSFIFFTTLNLLINL